MKGETYEMKDVIEFISANPWLTIIGFTCIIEIVPIKVNPWSKLFQWIGKQINKDLDDRIQKLEDKVDSLNEDVSEERVQNKRWNTLNFANSCRRGILHTHEEWDHCLDELKWYEKYCKEHHVTNGVIEENSKWLKKRYNEHLENDDFLKD